MDNKQLLNLVETILHEEEDILVPVEKLHELILQEKEDWPLELEELETVIKADPRFVLLDNPSTQEPWEDSEDEKMRELGFYRGQRVYLAERITDTEDLLAEVTEKMHKSLEMIKSVFDHRPEDLDPARQQELIEINKRVRELKQKLSKKE